MKKFAVIPAVLASAAAVFVGARLGAQPVTGQPPADTRLVGTGPGQAQPQTRVAFVNVARVFHDYDKAKFYKTQTEKAIEPKRLSREKLAKEIVLWKQSMTDPKFDPKNKDWYNKAIVKNQRDIEDLDREMRHLLNQENEQQFVQLYKELNDAVRHYAQAHNFQVVLAHVEPIQGDPFNIINIVRKLQGMEMGGTVTALHVTGGLDISANIVAALNQSYRAAGGAVVPATPAATPKK